MSEYIKRLDQINPGDLPEVGVKALNLGKLMKIDGLRIPDGFCLSQSAYATLLEKEDIQKLLGAMHEVEEAPSDQLYRISTTLRHLILAAEINDGVVQALRAELDNFGSEARYAVRSSGIAEDLPEASFAGQYESYLDVRGEQAILEAIKKCWASLYSERAIGYRIQKGLAPVSTELAVIVQQMVSAEKAGVLFTADPITSDRRTMRVNAAKGLGGDIVAGQVTPDEYHVQGKTITRLLTVGREPVLNEKQILELAEIGKRIEAYYGTPQDIEWCLKNGVFYIVQSRSITTLFPLPQCLDDYKHVFASIGHMQVMTEPFRPLGMSFFELGALYPLDRIGGRLYVDISKDMNSRGGRSILTQKLETMDPLMKASVDELLSRPGFTDDLEKGKGNLSSNARMVPWLRQAFRIYRKGDPRIIEAYTADQEQSLERLRSELEQASGADVFQIIRQDRDHLLSTIFNDMVFGSVLACQFAASRINKLFSKHLRLEQATDFLSKAVEHNITSEMGNALCDVADVLRAHPEAIPFFESEATTSLEELVAYPGGTEVARALVSFMDQFGMRCTGEVDITSLRWHEHPSSLFQTLLSEVENLTDEEHKRNFAAGKKEVEKLQEKLKGYLSKRQYASASRAIRMYRDFIGVREYPKYFWMRRFDLYKRAFMLEADRLVEIGVLSDRTDCYFLTLDEFEEAVRSSAVDMPSIQKRKVDYQRFRKLTPPRIITSDGEVPQRNETQETSDTTLRGIPVSSGVIEGNARVIESLDDAHLDKGDILVTRFTDPSWTPAFVVISGLITEVGGSMSHGAVITREYGLPAVVGVVGATHRIKDGQRIRLNGTTGTIEELPGLTKT